MNKEIETYSIKVTRPEGLSDSQWEAFCELMDGEDFEDKCLWDAVDEFTSEVKELAQ
jgi:hypothetical protein